MKKMLLLVVCVCTCISVFALTIEVETPSLKYLINGAEVEMPDGEQGFLYNDRTYVPIRFIAEALDKNVQWDDATNTVIISDIAADMYKIIDNSLCLDGHIVNLSYLDSYGDIKLEKVYKNILVFSVEKEDDYYKDLTVYDLYYTNLETKKINFIETAFDGLVGGPFQYGFMENTYYYTSRETCDIAAFSMEKYEYDHYDISSVCSLVWEENTIYYTSWIDDYGVFVKEFGKADRLITNINIKNACIYKYGDYLICYDIHSGTEQGCVIDLNTNKIVREVLTEAEINSVIIREMMIYDMYGEYEYNPELTMLEPFNSLQFQYEHDGIIIYKCNDLNENSFPKTLTAENGRASIEIMLEYIGDDLVKLEIPMLNSKERIHFLNVLGLI